MTERAREPGAEQAEQREVEREQVDPSEESPGRTSEGYGGTSPASGLDRAEVERMNEAAEQSPRGGASGEETGDAPPGAERDVERG